LSVDIIHDKAVGTTRVGLAHSSLRFCAFHHREGVRSGISVLGAMEVWLRVQSGTSGICWGEGHLDVEN